MIINNIEFDTWWSMDCGGKQDFDFGVLKVSTRYWPDFTAKPAILLGNKEIYFLPANEYIRGDSEVECKYLTEMWIKEKLTEVINKLI